jgi:hypothetical protein
MALDMALWPLSDSTPLTVPRRPPLVKGSAAISALCGLDVSRHPGRRRLHLSASVRRQAALAIVAPRQKTPSANIAQRQFLDRPQ